MTQDQTKEITVHAPGSVEVVPDRAPMTPMDMLVQAVDRGANVDVLEKLMGLQERWEANNARKAFDAAMAAAKSKIPVIAKSRKVDFTSNRGRTNYSYEDLGVIAKTVDPILAEFGLYYRFNTETANGQVTVTCIVSHRDGHIERNTLSAGHDQSGNKNSIQAVGSTITYLQRYTLKAALGLAAADDDDGRVSEDVAAPETISPDQVKVILRLLDETNSDVERFCSLGKIDAVPDMLKSDFDSAVRLLNDRKAKMARMNAENNGGQL